jgi:peptide deformylase
VRLLDFVEQDHGVGLAAHGLGELAALVVADVAGRRADHPRDAVLLHVFTDR